MNWRQICSHMKMPVLSARHESARSIEVIAVSSTIKTIASMALVLGSTDNLVFEVPSTLLRIGKRQGKSYSSATRMD